MLRWLSFPVASAAWMLAAALCAGSASAANYYVAVGGNDAGPGTLGDPFATFARAAQAMVPGDTTFVRGGTYNETVRPTGSGQPGLPLTWSAYADEEPVVTDVPLCINLSDRSHVVVDGFTCDGMEIGANSNVSVGAAGHRGTYNEIRNCTFRNLATSGVHINTGHHNVIRDNTFEFVGSTDLVDGRAVLLRQGASSNLVEANDFSHASHNLVYIHDQASYNIVRGNRMTNPWWRAVGLIDGTRRNIIEDNEIFGVRVPPGYSGVYPSALQLSNPETLVRRNVFYDNIAEGILNEAGSDPNNFDVARNRFVHNVFYRNAGVGLSYGDSIGSSVGLTDSGVFANNIAFDNSLLPPFFPDPTLQLDIHINGPDPLNGNEFFHNLIQDGMAEEIVINVTGIAQAPLAYFQTNHPLSFWGNIEGNPLFVDVFSGDFSLTSSSPAVDAGSPLTVAVAAGSGDELVVEDASFFSDGYDLVPGDWIQLEGGERAVVCRVDYFSNTLTLDRSLSWSAGEGVAYAYEGAAPDLGAFERNLGAPPQVTCPELPPLPECSDRIDNDGDMFVDFPDDPGCFSPTSNTESPACNDGIDNDGDGGIDYDGSPPDPQCTSASHHTEAKRTSCGLGAELALLLPLGWAARRARRRPRAGRRS